MSSICGIFYRDGRPVETSELDAMVRALAHWTPDRVAQWRHAQAGLGHLALWNTPEAIHENVPYREPASGVVVTADARIDNRDELIAAFTLGQRPAREIGDVELIARAYLKWGDACVSHLIGDFAFGLWDPRNQRMLCARDPLGMRPLYYFANERCLLFATELKGMLALPEVPREEELARFALYVTGVHTTDLTRFRALRLLRPAHILAVDASGLRLQRYWRLDPERETRFRRDEDYVEAFEEIFQKAVDARLRSPGRVGCMLSGGLDATTMLGFALGSRQSTPDRLTGYTWALRPGDDWRLRDEREYVDAFLREHPIDHHYLVLPSERIFEDNLAIEHLEDGPITEFQHCPMTETLRHARQRNIRVLLHGDGGDETASHGAQDYFMHLLMHLDVGGLRREAQADCWRGASEWQVWKSYFLRPVLRRNIFRAPFRAQKYYWECRDEMLDPGLGGIPLTREFAAESNLVEHWDKARPRLNWSWRNPVRGSQINLITGTDIMAKLATSCNFSVLHGIECRLPYLDRRVVEYCVSVPVEQHRSGGWARLLLRRSADKRIPAKIARRRDKSSTWPDIVRGISRNDEKLRASFARWAKNPRVAHCLDLPKLQGQLQAINALARGDDASHPPVGMFCHAVFLGQFLEHSST